MLTKEMQQLLLNSLNNVMRSCMTEADKTIIASLKGFSRESLKNEEYLSSALQHDYASFKDHQKNCLNEFGKNKIVDNIKSSDDASANEAMNLSLKFMNKYFGADIMGEFQYRIETLETLQFIENNKNDLLNAIPSIPAPSQDNPYADIIQDYAMSVLGLAGKQEGDISLEDLGL